MTGNRWRSRISSCSGWYGSPAYQAILPLRTNNIDGDAIVVTGVDANYSAANTAAMLRGAQ